MASGAFPTRHILISELLLAHRAWHRTKAERGQRQIVFKTVESVGARRACPCMCKCDDELCRAWNASTKYTHTLFIPPAVTITRHANLRLAGTTPPSYTTHATPIYLPYRTNTLEKYIIPPPTFFPGIMSCVARDRGIIIAARDSRPV